MKFLTAIIVVVILSLLGGAAATATADSTSPSATYQGKTAVWWANRAVQARKDANARTKTIKRLKKTMAYQPTIEEALKLATIIYPKFTAARGWQIMRHESLMVKDPAHAYNSTPVSGCHASGITQMLDGPSSCSTWKSTPFGRAGISVWSIYGQILGMGWMHETGRGREWQIGTGISGK